MIIPAIDLLDGEAVRLYKGDYEQKTVYSKNPAELAQNFKDMGAKFLRQLYRFFQGEIGSP